MDGVTETIAAIATPLGAGGLGVIRLSGPNAISIAAGIFSNPAFSQAPGATLHHGFLISDDASSDHPLDEVVMGLFRAPASYTGEDVVEISCHGSPVVLKAALDLCCARGARLARPGEFTQRAFLNGKMDLAQAEAVAALIHAKSDGARKQAVDQLRGHFSNQLQTLRHAFLDALAHLEASLDFVEDDIPQWQRNKAAEQVSAAIDDLAHLIATYKQGRLLRDGVRVVLAGPPNAGKSSLFNAFLLSDRAIVSDIPGTTRDTLEEPLQWNSMAVLMVDTAGLREGGDELEAKGMARTHFALENADVVFYVIDAAVPLEEKTQSRLKTMDPKKTVLVLNKIDKTPMVSFAEAALLGFHVAEVSAKTGKGLQVLRDIALKLANAEPAPIGRGAVVTHERHAECLRYALAHAQQALEGLTRGQPDEAVALELKQALAHMGAITGHDGTSELLDKIFSTFCIGK